MRKLSVILLVISLTSCTYLNNWFGNSREITITTSDGKLAYCTLKNKAGEWRSYSGRPIRISSDQSSDLRVVCAMNYLRASKLVKADAKTGYPDHVMVIMHARKKITPGADNSVSPKDNDEDSVNDLNNEDLMQDGASKPLNVLPDAPADDNEVVIIKHK